MSQGWGHLITWMDPSMGHLSGILARVGENLNNNFQKSQMPGGLPGGEVEASIWPIHKNWQKFAIRGKASWFQITHDIRYANFCKFVAFSTLLRTPRFFFIIYSALSKPHYFFAVRYVVTFERMAKNFSSWKWFTAAIQDHISISFEFTPSTHENTNHQKCKNSCDCSKVSFSNFQIKNFSLVP